jgi:hypothetical protein
VVDTDVFLSYNSADKQAVELVARRLRKGGIRPWFDKWSLVPGKPFQEGIEDALRCCGSCAVFFGPSGSGPWQNAEFRAAIDRRIREARGSFQVIPVLLPGARRNGRLPQIPPFLAACTWVEFPTIKDTDAFHRLVCGIRGVPPGTKRFAKVLRGDRPTRWVLVLHGTYSDFDKARAETIAEALREILGDASLRIARIDEK